MDAVNPRLARLSDDDRQMLESWLAEFQQHWDEKLLENRVEQIPPGSSWRLSALAEMVKIDLNQRWRHGDQISLEKYCKEFPELGSPANVPADLIQAEYEVRRQCGAPVALEDYLRRFPHQAAELGRVLDEKRTLISGPVPEPETPDATSPASHPRENRPNLPERFGRYRIIARLGQGGMGTVFLAEDIQLRRRVALKIPELGPERGPEARERFYREARIAATLDYRNLCPVYDAGEIDGHLYLTMAYVEGESLAEWICRERLTPRLIAALVGKLALAMQEAHARGVIHRDLKPANIMMRVMGQRHEPVIVDFGLARRDDANEARLTRAGQVMGTLAYMAPEQIRDDVKELGPVCDIYALGVILYELLTGRLPFRGSGLALVGQILTETPEPPSEYRPDLDPRLEAICLKAMARNVEDRYASMTDLATALADFLHSVAPSSSSSSTSLAPRTATQAERPVGSDALVAQFFELLYANKSSPHPIPTPNSGSSQILAPDGRQVRWLRIVPVALLGALLLGGIVLVTTQKGRIRIVANDPKAVVKVDDEVVRSNAQGEPITLRAGKHKLDVTWGRGGSQSRTFVVHRGDNESLYLEPDQRSKDRKTRPGSSGK
jgi:serine/threonine protein kinase